MTFQENIWQKYVLDNEQTWERFFASTLWKKLFLPWLKAQREIKIRTVLDSKDADTRDVARGMVLALEMISNLPAAMAASKKMKTEAKQEPPQETTFYGDSIHFEENN